MHYYEYGKENDKTIVFLHGANFVHSFGRQYPLAEKYHLIIPHIMGYGDAVSYTHLDVYKRQGYTQWQYSKITTQI